MTILTTRAAIFLCFVFSVAAAAAQPAPAPVSLKAPDGIVLKATYFAAEKPGPAILLLHQCNRERKTWTSFATDAASRGFHVLALDYRGYGESEGQQLENFQEQQAIVTAKWPGDIDTAFNWLTTQPGVDGKRVGAAGASCGVNQSVLLARRHPEVRTVVLLSGNVIQEGREYLRKATGLPVLAVASQDDGDAVRLMRWIMEWSASPSNRFVEYKAAGHGTDMFEGEKGLQPLMLEWLEKHLLNVTSAPANTGTPPPPTLAVAFWTTLTQPGGAELARKIFDEARQRNPEAMLFPEAEMNLYGYQLLQEGNARDAIVVLQMNVDANPRSANTYDSLSDAHLAAGHRDEALEYAAKALEVLSTDTNVEEPFRSAIRESAAKKVRELKKSL